jgi:hypothetical protein
LTLRDNQQLEHRLRASINAAIITSPRRRTIILIVAASSSRSPRYICLLGSPPDPALSIILRVHDTRNVETAGAAPTVNSTNGAKGVLHRLRPFAVAMAGGEFDPRLNAVHPRGFAGVRSWP